MRRKKGGINAIMTALILFCVQFNIFATQLYHYGAIKKVTNGIIISSLILLLIDLLAKRIEYKKIIALFLLVAIGVVVYFASNDLLFIYGAAIGAAILNYKKEKIIRIDLMIKCFVFLLIVGAFCLGLANDMSGIRNGEIRQALGFAHPNSLGFMLVLMNMNLSIIAKKRLPVLLFGAIALMLAISADSRSAIVILAILLMVEIIGKKRIERFVQKRKRTLFYIAPILLIAISIFSTILYKNGNRIAYTVNEGLSGRIAWQERYMSTRDVTLFGNNIDYSNRPLDNGYFRITYSYGLFGACTLIILYELSMKKMLKDDELQMAMMLVVLLLYALMEWYPFRIAVNIIPLYFFLERRTNNETVKS